MASWEDFQQVLLTPLESLVVPADQVHCGSSVDRWDLPAGDRAALRQFGLPKGPRAVPEPQVEPDPILVPNVAGPAERALVSPDQRLYRLGQWGPHEFTPVVGAVAGEGRVLGLLRAPLTAADLHRDLRPHNPNFHRPAVQFLNSSVAAYVEASWRWYAAVAVLRRIEEPRGAAEYLAFRDEELAQRHRFLAGLAAIDPAVGDGELGSLWVATVTES